MLLLYNFLLTILFPVWVPWMLWRAYRREEKPSWNERMGDYAFGATKESRRIWVHAVSVGEVVAALPILAALRRHGPEFEVVLSVTTSSGHATARQRAADLVDHIVYFPIDVVRFQAAALSRVRPEAVAIMETELWPNFLWMAKSFQARTVLVNGRISPRSYARALRFRFFYRAVLTHLDEALMQTPGDARRIEALGASCTEVLGNCKFDQDASGPASRQHWRSTLGIPEDAPTIVIGSTRGAEEEAFVQDALLQLQDIEGLTVVHAPRHLERADELATAVTRAFGAVARRSRGETGRYLILDTYGELASVYAVADVAVVGGGFAKLGGQNLIQPLALGIPVLHGPHMHNFADVTAMSIEANASRACTDSTTLATELRHLLTDPMARRAMGEAGLRLVEANRGASDRYAQRIVAAARAAR